MSRTMHVGIALASIVALTFVQAIAGSSGYFPEGVKLPQLDMSQYVESPSFNDFLSPLEGLDGHPARFLPVNHTKARFYACPWAFAPPIISKVLLVAPRRLSICNARFPACDTSNTVMSAEPSPQSGRRAFLRLAVAGALGVAVGGSDVQAQSIKDIMDEREAEIKRKADLPASMPQRPKELRNKDVCFKWNGEEKCTKCTTECERYKTLNPNLDCDSWCTVEYGQPKPTDEESISFNVFIADANKGNVERVDFYGYSGDRAYATYKSDGRKIRIGEGFPVEVGNEASSPLLVVRYLQQKNIPFKFHFLDGIKYKKIG